MRKFLTALLVVALLATAVLCVSCKSFEGTALEAFEQMKNDGKIEYEYAGGMLTKVTYDGLTIGNVIPNDYINSKYPMLYVNLEEYAMAPSGMGYDMDNYTYQGELFYPAGVGLGDLVYKKGMKLLVLYTEATATGYGPAKGDALLFTLPDGVKKTTID